MNGERRSLVLRSATWIANAYLPLFAACAAVLAASWAAAAIGAPEPTGGRVGVVATNVLVAASVATALLLLFVPHLPRGPFLPAIAATALVVAGRALHLVVDADVAWLDATLPVAAIASAALLRRTTGGWLLSPSRLPRKRHLLVRTVVATIVATAGLALVAVASLALGVLHTLERTSGGHLDVTPSGITVRESVFVKDGRRVVLLPMLHYGEDDFYRRTMAEIDPGSLVLAEGITDHQQRLLAFPSAAKLASALGLTQQPDAQAALEAAAKPAAGTRAAGAASVTAPEVVSADIDASELSEATIGILHDLAGIFDGAPRPGALRRIFAPRSEDSALVMRELIDDRNAKVLATLDEHAHAHGTIVIPWGVMHMPGLEAGLRERSYEVGEQRIHPVIRFGSLRPAP